MDSDGDDRAEDDDENDPVGLGVYLWCRWQSASSGQLPDASGGFQRTRLRSHSPPVIPMYRTVLKESGSEHIHHRWIRASLRASSTSYVPSREQANPPSALCGERNTPRVVAACSG